MKISVRRKIPEKSFPEIIPEDDFFPMDKPDLWYRKLRIDMDEVNICPCPNLECPNHGDCKKCISRHLRIQSLNYCAFYSILSELEGAVKASPHSNAAQIIKKRIERQKKAYQKCMNKHGLSKEYQNMLRIEKSKLSEH